MQNRIKPEDLNIPAEFQHWVGDAFEDYVGPFFFRTEGEITHTAFRIQAHNCNAHQVVHGGMLMTFADYTLCMAATSGSQEESVVTVTCNNEFIGPAYEGDLVLGRGEVTRKGGSLIFTRVTLEANGKTILTSSGVVKRLRNK